MAEYYASRNLRLCSKDCMCLYVCPTGATDTETGQIDFARCTGCGACVKSCPSGAISLIPYEYPIQQKKNDGMCKVLQKTVASKAVQENIAGQIAESTDDPVLRQLMDAINRSNRLMAEDLVRESGYMLPQSGNVRSLLEEMLASNHGPDFPEGAVRELLKLLRFNE